ncbi:SOUL heme-binding family protein [Mycobacterium ulcerans str. Harvey]|uniref:SOUL heme-binding family protein n=1 Tax=Mycobacterium ulcerans str. Harvey TaxID=1299332 RepID=A0ABN0R086_MYCUL|nr:SOUL heme-binding family protein [Mycobacterium ulcerans str. Harvey]
MDDTVFMPAKWTLDTLPVPNDNAVALVAVPAETYAVLRFSGDRGAGAVAARTTELLGLLDGTDLQPVGSPVAWFYDPPWTIPCLRRNEIAVPVTRR